MGGKSRKQGSVSKKLIERLKASKNTGEGKKSCGSKKPVQPGKGLGLGADKK